MLPSRAKSAAVALTPVLSRGRGRVFDGSAGRARFPTWAVRDSQFEAKALGEREPPGDKFHPACQHLARSKRKNWLNKTLFWRRIRRSGVATGSIAVATREACRWSDYSSDTA